MGNINKTYSNKFTSANNTKVGTRANLKPIFPQIALQFRAKKAYKQMIRIQSLQLEGYLPPNSLAEDY